jgi:hypothetical protein
MKIKIIFIGINQKPKDDSLIPIQEHSGLETQADVDPVMAKTINIIVN